MLLVLLSDCCFFVLSCSVDEATKIRRVGIDEASDQSMMRVPADCFPMHAL